MKDLLLACATGALMGAALGLIYVFSSGGF